LINYWSGFRGGPEESLARQVEFDRLPRHVAIIMDGNGRWAGERHCRASRAIAPASIPFATSSRPARLGLEVLTLYAFSVENWKRPRRSQHADDAAEALPRPRAQTLLRTTSAST
jgi:undecaprenyl pyrophosphate synthase